MVEDHTPQCDPSHAPPNHCFQNQDMPKKIQKNFPPRQTQKYPLQGCRRMIPDPTSHSERSCGRPDTHGIGRAAGPGAFTVNWRGSTMCFRDDRNFKELIFLKFFISNPHRSRNTPLGRQGIVGMCQLSQSSNGENGLVTLEPGCYIVKGHCEVSHPPPRSGVAQHLLERPVSFDQSED